MSDTDRTWYLGPVGDLRPLVCPAMDIQINEERYGGVHQGLSGARTLDVLGFRATYQMSLEHLDPSEFAWVEALYTGLIPGPFRLINPLKRNRLSHQATTLKLHAGHLGLTAPGGTVIGPSSDWPTELTLPGRSMRLTSGGNAWFRFDEGRKTTIFGPGEDVVVSMYMKADAPMVVWLEISLFDESDVEEFFYLACNVTTTWTRFWTTMEVPAGKVKGMLGFEPQAAGDFNIAAPMFETGTTPTDWEVGGGAPEVIFDQMPTTSHRYPLRTVPLTLLET